MAEIDVPGEHIESILTFQGCIVKKKNGGGQTINYVINVRWTMIYQ